MTKRWRDRFSSAMQGLDRAAASTVAVVTAVLLVIGWLGLGAVNGFTDRWFAWLYAGTGIAAFVMVFLIRHADSREARATLLKLDELVAATSGASDRVIGVEQEPLDHQERLEDGAPHGSTSTADSLDR